MKVIYTKYTLQTLFVQLSIVPFTFSKCAKAIWNGASRPWSSICASTAPTPYGGGGHHRRGTEACSHRSAAKQVLTRGFASVPQQLFCVIVPSTMLHSSVAYNGDLEPVMLCPSGTCYIAGSSPGRTVILFCLVGSGAAGVRSPMRKCLHTAGPYDMLNTLCR